jgi:hypothetical protein
MFLRRTERKKDGKVHSYWSIVENKRVAGGRMVQRHALYLGEINSSQAVPWRKAIEVFDEDAGRPRTLALFAEDRSTKRRGSEWRDRPARRHRSRQRQLPVVQFGRRKISTGVYCRPLELARRSGEELQGTDGDKGEYSEDDQAALHGRDEERAHQVVAGQPPQLPSHH